MAVVFLFCLFRKKSKKLTCGLLARLISTAATMVDGTAHYAEKVGDTEHKQYFCAILPANVNKLFNELSIN